MERHFKRFYSLNRFQTAHWHFRVGGIFINGTAEITAARWLQSWRRGQPAASNSQTFQRGGREGLLPSLPYWSLYILHCQDLPRSPGPWPVLTHLSICCSVRLAACLVCPLHRALWLQSAVCFFKGQCACPNYLPSQSQLVRAYIKRHLPLPLSPS